MTFERAWVLWLAWLPLIWAGWQARSQRRRGLLWLKAFSLCAIAVALSGPALSITSSKLAVGVLVDTSLSLSEQDLKQAGSLVARIVAARGRHWLRVIPFARTTRELYPGELGQTWNLRYSEGEAGRATNLEAAVGEALAQLPPGLVPKLVLISDGMENEGSAARAAWQARQAGVPIDSFPLAGRSRSQLRLDSVAIPAQAFTGEKFPIDLTVYAPRSAEADVQILAAGKSLGISRVKLEAGPNMVRVHARLSTAGAVDLTGVIRAGELGEASFAQAVTIRLPAILLVSGDPLGQEKHLTEALKAAGFQLERRGAEALEDPGRYQIVVLNNWDLESLPAGRKAALEEFVKSGGGLLVIAGENNVYVDKKGVEDALDRLLPAKVAPPRAPEGTAVVLILDKSSSMEGKKIELARLAAVGVVEHLRPIDLIGILIFDNSFHWVVPIRKADDPNALKRLIAGIMADGGTQIAPALQEAYRRILPVRAVYKHIVLLTDGISEEGDSMMLARDAVANRVTISTVGLGQDVNRAFLERVALTAGGKAYFMSDPSGLEQILIRDVMEHTGTSLVEKAFRPLLARKAEILEGIAWDAAPPLAGYVKFIAKPTAEVLLKADERDPLLVRWQYGLGRAAVFSSDAKSRWAAQWIRWAGFDKFWINLLRDLLPKAPASDARVSYSAATGEVTVEYRLGAGLPEPPAPPDIFLVAEPGFRRVIKLARVAPGSYRGSIYATPPPGLLRVRPLEESRAFPETGLYLQEPELSEYGSNPALLEEMARFSGGKFQPAPEQVFDAGGRGVRTRWRLWPLLLVLAVVLNLSELVWRKWPGVIETLRAAGSRQPEPDSAWRWR